MPWSISAMSRENLSSGEGNQAGYKPASSVTETGLILETLYLASTGIIYTI